MSTALIFSRPISRRGQVVVPKDVRVHLKIRDEVIFEVHEDRVVIRGGRRQLSRHPPEFFAIKRLAATSFFVAQFFEVYECSEHL